MKTIKLLFGGDICGAYGLSIALQLLPSIIQTELPDFVVLNGENALNGSGISIEQAHQLFAIGVDVITGGNHTLERFDLRSSFGTEQRIIRPANYPYAPGKGFITIEKNGIIFTVINLQGRENMRPIDCPFQTADTILLNSVSSCIFIDFHAESVQEKEALAYYLDGRISCLFGTHTHTQTADERILTHGTGYITDAGMIGGYDAIIGGSIESAIQRSLTLIRQPFSRFEPRQGIFCGVIAEIDYATKKTVKLKRLYHILETHLSQ
ncbi:MAG: TIGR00282 family metallophosphoesterase [Treponema sp.]